MLSFYRRVAADRYQERYGLDFEDFAPGQRFRHRPGVTLSQQDNADEALDTLNGAMLHFDAQYAAQTSWQRPLLVSTLTLQRVIGMAGKTYGRRTAILGFPEIVLNGPLFGQDTLYSSSEVLSCEAGGTVTVLGRPAGTPELRRRVGYLTQAPSVYADLTVRENARYFAALHGRSRADADRAVADVGLREAAGQLVGTLSGGQRSRASLACALVGEPELIVLDEPTVGQDPVLRADLWARFHELAASGATLLVSSHVMDEAARCDRLLLIREGRLVADDTPAAIRAAAGVADLDEAFLRLIRASETGGAVATGTGGPAGAAGGETS